MSKPGLDIILGLGKPKPGKEPDDEEGSEDLSDPAEDAAAELMQALEDKDAKAVAEAFKTLQALTDKDDAGDEE